MLKERIEAFAALGDRLSNLDVDTLQEWSQLAKSENNWFTEENVKTALQSLTTWLTAEKLTTGRFS